MDLCLCMIVKNESKIITDCLDSVINYINYWIICDTGSTDGTQSVIIDYFNKKSVKGELFEDKWIDFGTNRTLAMERAKNKAKYIFVIDADDILHGNLQIPEHTHIHKFFILLKIGNLEYYRSQIFKGNLDWKYEGIVHEYADLKNPRDISGALIRNNLTNCHIIAGTYGNRSNNYKDKFTKDIKLLHDGLLKTPNNTRYIFYLAQSYKDLGDNENAIIWYNKYLKLEGWDQETFISLYSIGICKERANYNFEKDTLYSYLRAFHYRPSRLEPIYRILAYFRKKSMYNTGFGYGMLGYKIKKSTDILFIEKDIYDYKYLDELAICAYYVGFHQMSFNINEQLLRNNDCPQSYYSRLQKNKEYSVDKLL
jgi:glycosyltransferase involved in cell wall biosynthesis